MLSMLFLTMFLIFLYISLLSAEFIGSIGLIFGIKWLCIAEQPFVYSFRSVGLLIVERLDVFWFDLSILILSLKFIEEVLFRMFSLDWIFDINPLLLLKWLSIDFLYLGDPIIVCPKYPFEFLWPALLIIEFGDLSS